MKTWKDYPINEVFLKDKNYPSLLRNITDPPQKLFYRGTLTKDTFKKSISIVGSRQMTTYGKVVVEKFVTAFIGENVSIISGFMYGVDAEVHKRCVEYGGITAAVFGNGLNICYPEENGKIYNQILESGGVVISEYEPNAKPHIWTYPQRNRIVAGIPNLGVLVVEAGEESGSLITAKIAIKEKRKVYAIPGPITSSVSKGTNMLLKTKKAIFVTEPGDIIGGKEKITQNTLELNGIEAQIYKAIENEALTIDEISMTTNLEVVEVNKSVSLLALKGILIEIGGKYMVGKK